MDVDDGHLGDVQQGLGQELAVGRHHDHIGLQSPKLLQNRLVPAGLGLVNGDILR